ncbi:MAG: DEAD/DEAH box helicase, partial [Gammaproteobacteria bacterium]
MSSPDQPVPAEVAPEPVTALSGVGPALAEKLARLSVRTVQDLLFLLPLRYEDRTRLVDMGALRPGMRVTIEGEIELSEVVFRKRRMLLCQLADGTGSILLRFFYFSRAQAAGLRRGTRMRCFGEVRLGPSGLEMVHPEYRRLAESEALPLDETLTPIYPGTEGLQQRRVRRLVEAALARLDAQPPADLIPRERLSDLGLPSLIDALRYVHHPPPEADLALLEQGMHPCQQRLAFEELLAHQLSLRLLRRQVREHRAPELAGGGRGLARFLAALPFELTGAQRRVLDEILADIAAARPMLRLVQGDVGSGKTVVAAAAAVRTVEAGAQAAIMAPTELLAEQHQRNFSSWLEPMGIKVSTLTGRLGAADRRAALEAIGSGGAGVVVGTHALFQAG